MPIWMFFSCRTNADLSIEVKKKKKGFGVFMHILVVLKVGFAGMLIWCTVYITNFTFRIQI